MGFNKNLKMDRDYLFVNDDCVDIYAIRHLLQRKDPHELRYLIAAKRIRWRWGEESMEKALKCTYAH